jgi:hypothetical protein
VDSLQQGDEPDYDGLLELFPQSFHEPYYLSYIKEDFAALCQDRGLTYIRNARAFVSKVIGILLISLRICSFLARRNSLETSAR